MSDNSSGFTVTDRRKFTLDGELRDTDAAQQQEEPSPSRASAPVSAPVAEAPEQPKEIVDAKLEPLPVGEGTEGDESPLDYDAEMEDTGMHDGETAEMPELTAEETAEQHAAYRQSSDQLDDMIAKANPGVRRPAATAMDFDKLVQSIYMTAALQLGAGTQPNEQPRVDILGARQSIDMLNVLVEKTKGNLTDKEQRLLQNALFELRMTFLEITNAISSSAHNPPPGRGPGRGSGLV